MKLALLLLASLSLHAQGWTVLTGTTLASACPANGFGGISFAAGGAYPFATNCGKVLTAWSGGALDTVSRRMIFWGGGHSDYYGNEVYALNLTTPAMVRLTDPSVFNDSLCTGCPSNSSGVNFSPINGGSPDTNADTGTSSPTGAYSHTLSTGASDGTPVSRHTYNGIVYLPHANRLFAYTGSKMPGGQMSQATWTLDLNVTPPVWHSMDPTGGAGSTWASPVSAGAVCAYDPIRSSSTHDIVICVQNSAATLRIFDYTVANNTISVTTPTTHPGATAFGPLTAATAVIDPDAQVMYFVGDSFSSAGTAGFYELDISLSTTWTLNNWSSLTTGCSAVATIHGPGAAYDTVLQKPVFYPLTGDSVYIFDQATKTCTASTFTGGPGAVATNGTYGKFAYLPWDDSFIIVNKSDRDAYKLHLTGAAPTPATINGLGGSSYFCVDRDGDGYGTGPVALGPYTDLVINGADNTKVTSASHSFVAGDIGRVITITGGTGFTKNWFLIASVSAGAATLLERDGFAAGAGTVSSTGGQWVIYGCLGPDADDLDAATHTATQVLSKFGTVGSNGTMQGYLTYRGYTPTRIWLIDSTGSPTAASCTPATFESGCLAAPRSVPPASGSMAAGDMVMIRSNVNAVVHAASGTSVAPVIIMAYPGETPFLITGNASVPNLTSCGAGTCLSTNGLSWVIVDGLEENGSIGLGDSNYAQNPHPFHDNIFRHIYGGPAGYQGLGPHAGGDNVTIEDSVFAHNFYGGSQAGLYIGCTYITPCSSFIVQRNIAFNNAWDGIHWNGVGDGHIFTQNISHSNGISGLAFQSGLTNSTVSANLSFNNVSVPMQFYQYKDNDTSCTSASPAGTQPCGTGPTTGNLVENNTLVSASGGSFPTGFSGITNACFSVANHTPVNAFTAGPFFDMGANTFRNNICANWGDLSGSFRYAPFNFADATNPTEAQSYFATSTFDHNVTYEWSAINSGNALNGSGKAVFGIGWAPSGQSAEGTYDCTAAAALLTTGAITNCVSGDPKFVAFQQTYFWDPSLYAIRIYNTSPAYVAGSATGVPAFDLKGLPYIASPGPSMGAIEFNASDAQATTSTPVRGGASVVGSQILK